MSADLITTIQAKHWRWAARDSVDWVVMHSAETAERPDTAEALGNYAATMSDGRVASWHYAIDCDSIVQCVDEQHISFCAPGTNERGIQIELAGRARQSEAEWLDEYGVAMLELAANLVAVICIRWDIPVRFIDAAGLLAGERGITTHAEVTRGPGKGRTNHYDPGPHFPMERFLDMIADDLGLIRGVYEVSNG